MDKIEYEQSYFKKQQSIVLQESNPNPSSPLSTTATLASSSPIHEFSFTVSLQSPPAIDLTPADDIFFDGHLLPLHLPISPRSSTNSMDSFSLPINLLYDTNHTINSNQQTTFLYSNKPHDTKTTDQNRPKSKSFTIFRIPKWKNKERNNKKKVKIDLGQLIKRYIKMMRPLMSFSNSKRSNRESFSRSKLPEMNKGIRFGSGIVSPIKTATSESTMEELHAAIQAAIAHCKNSIDMEN